MAAESAPTPVPFTDEVVEHAVAMLSGFDYAVIPLVNETGREIGYRVSSTDARTAVPTGRHYRVQTDLDPADPRSLTWVTCTCAHGQRSGAGSSRCYHAAAALIWLRDRAADS